MKMITTVVRPHALGAVRRALERHAVLGMTVSEVCGSGRGTVEIRRGVATAVDLVPTLRIETIVHDDVVERVLDAIETTVATGRDGDGKLWVTPLEAVLRVRTGERGAEAV